MIREVGVLVQSCTISQVEEAKLDDDEKISGKERKKWRIIIYSVPPSSSQLLV